MTEKRISNITDKWLLRDPVLLMTLLSHDLVPAANIKSIRSGKGRIEYNPEYISHLSDDQFEEIIKIEVIRILLRHPYRQPSQNDLTISYIASNITLNEYYQFKRLPYRAVNFWNNPSFYQRNFEFYYTELQKTSFQGNENEKDDNNQNLSENVTLWEEDLYIDQKIVEIISFAIQNQSWGSLPNHLVTTLIASLNPVIDYRKVLQGFHASVLSSKKMPTRLKSSRRYGYLYMGKKYEFTTSLLIGVDVSGSISDEDINLFYSVITRFFHYGIQSLDVLQFDADIKGIPVIMKKARKTIKITGRGGTCFQPVIDYFSSKIKDYDGLIIFTDGYASIPELTKNIAKKTLWICNNKENYEQHYKWMSERGSCCWVE
ncbi:conserved hypothetical protein [Treponema primitia ZAS-2]|uniref:VWA-like domain-containing protein n=2 Tax=Treponema primitia TaxID=88058 RepID=F5YI57_TREPZ|nr:conserved hypothetical protein [Treponema primitia ZAS-2]